MRLTLSLSHPPRLGSTASFQTLPLEAGSGISSLWRHVKEPETVRDGSKEGSERRGGSKGRTERRGVR